MTQNQLLEHIPSDSLPQKFGGNLNVDHRHWLQVCAAIHQAGGPEVIENYFVSRKRFGSASRSSSDNSEFVHIDGAVDSEDSKDTVSEKQSNEEGEKDEMIDSNGFEKEVNFEKEDVRGHSKRRREASNANQSQNSSQKKSHDSKESHGMETNSRDLSPPEPCKKRSTSEWHDAIHMPEEGGMTVSDLAKYVKLKGKKGLREEYAGIRKEAPAGTFSVCKYVELTLLCYMHSQSVTQTYLSVYHSHGIPQSFDQK